MKKLRKRIKFIVLTGLALALLAELLLALATHAFALKIEAPTYSLENTQGFWFDLDPHFGTRHKPNDSYRQKKSCYNVLYTSNSAGFRDVERAQQSSKSRVVVLGDSFMEGVGVETPQRLSNLLDSATNRPFLNFGMAGNFGPTQYWQLYQHEASTYQHDAVLIGILPANDFIDDDYDLGHAGMANRYRPYLRGSYPNYELVYFQDSLHKSAYHTPQSKPVKMLLKNFTYSYNAWLYFRTAWRQATGSHEVLSYDELPGYFNYTEEQINRVQYALEQIKSLAGAKKVVVFTIPTRQDIAAYRNGYENTLGQRLFSICSKAAIQYIDLLPATDGLSEREADALFLPCDGHWSAAGHRFALEVLREAVD